MNLGAGDNSEDLCTRYSCNYCSYSTYVKSNLQVHKRTHTGERPFKCTLCSKSFTQKIHLQDHQRCHTGERPFSCSSCLKSFSTKYYVKKHVCKHGIQENAPSSSFQLLVPTPAIPNQNSAISWDSTNTSF